MIELIHGDCLVEMNKIPDKSIDLILCDLPYGVTANKADKIIPLDLLWKHYDRIIKNNGAIVLNAQEPFTTMLIASNLRDFKYKWVWSKHQVTGFLNAKRQPLRNCEDICVFYKQQCFYNPQMRTGKLQLKGTGSNSKNYNTYIKKPRVDNLYYPTQLLDFPLQRFKGGHPTQKPIPLLEYLIKTYTRENDMVLDNCMGSGSTGVACKNTNRNFIGIEKEEKYYEMAKVRIGE